MSKLLRQYISYNNYNIIGSYNGGMSEWLRRWASAPFGIAIVGSNPTVGIYKYNVVFICLNSSVG